MCVFHERCAAFVVSVGAVVLQYIRTCRQVGLAAQIRRQGRQDRPNLRERVQIPWEARGLKVFCKILPIIFWADLRPLCSQPTSCPANSEAARSSHLRVHRRACPAFGFASCFFVFQGLTPARCEGLLVRDVRIVAHHSKCGMSYVGGKCAPKFGSLTRPSAMSISSSFSKFERAYSDRLQEEPGAFQTSKVLVGPSRRRLAWVRTSRRCFWIAPWHASPRFSLSLTNFFPLASPSSMRSGTPSITWAQPASD